MRRWAWLLFWAGALPLAACGPAAPLSQPSTAPTSENPVRRELLEETWDAVFIDQVKVGHVHTRAEKVTTAGRETREITSQMELTIERFGQSTSQRLAFTSRETPSGELASFECKMSAGPTEMIAKGEVQGEVLEMDTSTLGKVQKGVIPWGKSGGGFFAVEQSLKAKPLQPGDKRELRALMPDFPFPSAPLTKLEALAVEPVELLEGSRELLKIKQTIELEGGSKIESFTWVDKQGETFKTQIISGLPQTSYRVSKEVALGKSSPAKFDLGHTTTVKVTRAPSKSNESKRVVYRAKLKDGEIQDAFAAGATQTVRLLDPRTAEIVVRAITPDDPAKLETADVAPTAADLEPNNLIQSDDPKVVALAKGVASSETDPWKLAVALEKHVKRSMKSSNFSQAFATAAETAESLEGDCTEHAMLLAAVCRARKLPARVAVGLVYDGKLGYAFHMWTEVWIIDRWIPLDATRGAGGIGASHLKLTHSNLQVSSVSTALFPVFNVLGRLELEILEGE